MIWPPSPKLAAIVQDFKRRPADDFPIMWSEISFAIFATLARK
jgi:hypothetical protein